MIILKDEAFYYLYSNKENSEIYKKFAHLSRYEIAQSKLWFYDDEISDEHTKEDLRKNKSKLEDEEIEEFQNFLYQNQYDADWVKKLETL